MSLPILINPPYPWLDKVLSVTENGKQIARFNYHNDGQIAQAIHNGKSEDFLWDGFALIHRGESSFINEPYGTGGNPVMAGDDVFFNDMLGSTLAVNGNPVKMTSFGETADKNAFFTGKPMIDELGYSFLFRNYNPNQGKWTTTDPLGYPDGWNNLAYVNNGVTTLIEGAIINFGRNMGDEEKRLYEAAINNIQKTESGKNLVNLLTNCDTVFSIRKVDGNFYKEAETQKNGVIVIDFGDLSKYREPDGYIPTLEAMLVHEFAHGKQILEDTFSLENNQWKNEVEACNAENLFLKESGSSARRNSYGGKKLE